MLRKLQASPAAEWAVRQRQQALEWAARQRQHMVAQETCTVSRTRSMACLGRGNHLLAGRYRDQGSFSRGCRVRCHGVPLFLLREINHIRRVGSCVRAVRWIPTPLPPRGGVVALGCPVAWAGQVVPCVVLTEVWRQRAGLRSTRVAKSRGCCSLDGLHRSTARGLTS